MSPLLLAVTGHPVLHSRSPALHGAALRAAGLEGHYLRLAAENAGEALATARQIGLRGMNVTAPFKEEMARLVDDIDDIAKEVGAVNTVVFDSHGRSRGYNTDVFGISEAFRSSGVSLKGARTLILGAGGAARAGAIALKRAGASVTIANRTPERARALAESIGAEHCSRDEQELRRALSGVTAVLNTISASESLVPSDLLHPGLSILEAQYKHETELAVNARARGARVIGGLEWLLHQAAEAFERFTGAAPDIQAMRRASAELQMHAPRSVALVGMMGSGKTTAGRELARMLGLPHSDLDALIESELGCSIAASISSRGEAHFRDVEHGLLRRSPAEGVLSTGGGVPLREENRRILRDAGLTVWLWVTPETALRRIGDVSSRPLLHGADPKERYLGVLERRRECYAACCDLVVPTDHKTTESIASSIAYEIRSTWNH